MKWISVINKLPEEFTEVMVKDLLGNEFIANYRVYEGLTCSNLTWYEDNEGFILYGITHWKPLGEK